MGDSDEVKSRQTEDVEEFNPTKGKNKSNGVPDSDHSDQEVEQLDEINDKPKDTEPFEDEKPTKVNKKKKGKGRNKPNGVPDIKDPDDSDPEVDDKEEAVSKEPVEVEKP